MHSEPFALSFFAPIVSFVVSIAITHSLAATDATILVGTDAGYLITLKWNGEIVQVVSRDSLLQHCDSVSSDVLESQSSVLGPLVRRSSLQGSSRGSSVSNSPKSSNISASPAAAATLSPFSKEVMASIGSGRKRSLSASEENPHSIIHLSASSISEKYTVIFGNGDIAILVRRSSSSSQNLHHLDPSSFLEFSGHLITNMHATCASLSDRSGTFSVGCKK